MREEDSKFRAAIIKLDRDELKGTALPPPPFSTDPHAKAGSRPPTELAVSEGLMHMGSQLQRVCK